MEDQIQLIPLEKIDRPVKISRELIDPEKVRELAESIRESGLLQPILLRPANGRFEVVAGDRRFLAHKFLDRKEIKAIVRELDDQETIVIRGIENLQRVDLNFSEEAAVYKLLKEEGGMSLHQIAKKTGKSPTTIQRYLRFAECPENVRRAVDKKEVSLLVLETLMEIPDQETFDYFFKMAVDNGISNTTARLWVDDHLKSRAGTYYESGGGAPLSNIEGTPKPQFMTCDVCHGPCEIKAVRSIIACPDCVIKIRKG